MDSGEFAVRRLCPSKYWQEQRSLESKPCEMLLALSGHSLALQCSGRAILAALAKRVVQATLAPSNKDSEFGEGQSNSGSMRI